MNEMLENNVCRREQSNRSTILEEGPSKGDLAAAKELSPNFSIHVPFPSAPGIQGI
jgi:hypothetical protein